MSSNFVIRKNTIEIKRERLIIHRKQVSCITYIDPIEGEVLSYGVGLWFNPPIVIESANGENQYIWKVIYVYCEDYLPFVEWFDNDEGVEIQKLVDTLKKHEHTGHKLEPSYPNPAPLGETLVDLLYATQKHICQCCRDAIASYVSERPELKNEFLCEVCYDAKIALAKIDKGEEADTMESLLPYVQPTEPIDPNFDKCLYSFTGLLKKELK